MNIPDPQSIPRTTMNRRPSRLCVCRLHEKNPDMLATRMTGRYLTTLAFSLLLGVGAIVLAGCLLADHQDKSGVIVFAGFGGLYLLFSLLAFRGTLSRLTVFDRVAGTFRQRNGTAICQLDQIAALQLLPPGEMRRNGEINLVLTDGTRLHLLSFPNDETMQQEAALLSRWLGGVAVWQNGGL